MLVRHRMTPNPRTIGPDEALAAAFEKMAGGQFRRLPVVDGGLLVGILSDRDLRRYEGRLKHVTVAEAMTEKPLTLSPDDTLERAAELMMRNKISGLPIVLGLRLVGILTTTDVMRAFLDVMGASAEGSVRIDLLWSKERDLGAACDAVREQDGEVLAVGAYRDAWGEQPVFYLRLRDAAPEAVSAALERRGFTVLGVHT